MMPYWTTSTGSPASGLPTSAPANSIALAVRTAEVRTDRLPAVVRHLRPGQECACSVCRSHLAWRHIGEQKALRIARMAVFRHSTYQAQLAVDQQPVRELPLASWLLGRQQARWLEAMEPVLADLCLQVHIALSPRGEDGPCRRAVRGRLPAVRHR